MYTFVYLSQPNAIHFHSCWNSVEKSGDEVVCFYWNYCIYQNPFDFAQISEICLIISTFWYQEMWMKMTFVFTGLPQHYVWDCLLHYQLFLHKSLFLTRHIKEIQWKQCDSRIVAFKNHSIQKCNFNHLYMNSVNKVKTVALMRTVSNTRHTLQLSTVVLILHEIQQNKVQAPRLFTGELFTREISRSVASILS